MTMFENLTEKLPARLQTLRRAGHGSPRRDIGEAMREIRVAPARGRRQPQCGTDLIEQIRVKAIGTEVLTALSPSEQVVKIVRDELIALLGQRHGALQIRIAAEPRR